VRNVMRCVVVSRNRVALRKIVTQGRIHADAGSVGHVGDAASVAGQQPNLRCDAKWSFEWGVPERRFGTR